MSAPSLQRRIRNGTLLMLALVVLLGLYTLPRLYALGGAIRATLYRNYVSIEAAQHMHADLTQLQVAAHDGRAKTVAPELRQDFIKWVNVENHDFTEQGEPELAADIHRRGEKLFHEIAAAPTGASHDSEFAELHSRLDDLIEMNKAAMFRADSRSIRLGKHLAYEFAGGLALVLIVGAAVSWGLGWRLSKPLRELTERLRGISQRKSQVRLGPQPLAELEAVAREFNQMAERLEQYDKLNVERIVYEKSKTEAIIESLEDGVVLIDANGVVAHINEIASLILGVDPAGPLGCPFDDLSSNHPHYLRVRDALRTLQGAAPDNGHRVEIDLHVRGREHSYVLKPVPLHHTEGISLGTLLIMQDVTYIRDQDRARTNLVATLSHELRTPLTSLALSAELMNRDFPDSNAKHHELLQVILEECTRMRQLTDNLLNLARGEIPAITLQQKRLDLAQLAAEVTKRFAIQAREKQVALEESIESVPEIIGDPVKLSWVISNLVGNALRYTPSGGTIKVSARASDGATRLEIADSGPGIPPEMKDYIFERFVQYGSDGFEKGSAGLGLSIVKEIVEAHGGRIFVESNNSHGSKFIVDIPAAVEV